VKLSKKLDNSEAAPPKKKLNENVAAQNTQQQRGCPKKIKQQRGRPPKNWTKTWLPKIQNKSEAVQNIEHKRGYPKQDSQCTYNGTHRRVRATIVAVEKQ